VSFVKHLIAWELWKNKENPHLTTIFVLIKIGGFVLILIVVVKIAFNLIVTLIANLSKVFLTYSRNGTVALLIYNNGIFNTEELMNLPNSKKSFQKLSY
jgi:hypothetical protein